MQFKQKPHLRFSQLWNLTFCSFGIQFGSALQMANMSAIYKYLGATADMMAILWLAGPVTGLITQPVIGYLSDHTWTRLGRRRPYMLFWAICAFIALILMPNSTSLWMAVILLWLLDFSNNGATQPFRALIADTANHKQQVSAFAMQAAFSGMGATIAALLPWLMIHFFRLKFHSNVTNSIPFSLKVAFYFGGTAFLLATLWTVFTTKEVQPEHINVQKNRITVKCLLQGVYDIYDHLLNVPDAIKQFYWVQLFTWIGLFCMWLYFGLAVAQNIYGLPVNAPISGHANYALLLEKGTAWGGVCFAVYQFVSVIYSLMLPFITRLLNPKLTHAISLGMGGIGLSIMFLFHSPYPLLLGMVLMGMTWGSIMAMPYAILAMELPPKKLGVYMGIFNITITVPQMISALILGPMTRYLFHNQAMSLVVFGGICLLMAAGLMMKQANQRKKRFQTISSSNGYTSNHLLLGNSDGNS